MANTREAPDLHLQVHAKVPPPASVGWFLPRLQVRRLGASAGETACIECDGAGIWTVLPGGGPIKCTTCKGKGRIMVSV